MTVLYAAGGGGIALLLFLLAVGKVPLRYNLRNLSLRWKTTAMTALAFTMVVGLLTVMLAFVNGMYRLTISSGQPGNVLILSDGAPDESVSNLGFSDIGDIENQKGIVRDGDKPLCSRETYLVVNQPIPQTEPGRPTRRFLQLRGVDDAQISGHVHGLVLHDGGRWFSAAGVESAKDGDGQPLIQAVVGEGVARVMGGDRTEAEKRAAKNPDRLEVGDLFALGDRRWIVVGVMRSSGSTFDSEVWAKRSLVGPMFGKATYSSLVVRADKAEGAVQLRDFFNQDYQKAAVAAQVETDYFEGLSETNRQFLVAIAFVAVVMAVGGVFGVMNTMFAAISQRRTDIGVMRLLGYRRGQILISFLLESLVIALVGGITGMALGFLTDGWSATGIVSGGRGGGKLVVLKLVVDHTVLAAGLALTLFMGVFGGLIPSINAMRLTALDALR